MSLVKLQKVRCECLTFYLLIRLKNLFDREQFMLIKTKWALNLKQVLFEKEGESEGL